MFGYAGNIVFYNIVSVSIDMIAYERINAENCLMKERCSITILLCSMKSADVYVKVDDVCRMWCRDVDRLR